MAVYNHDFLELEDLFEKRILDHETMNLNNLVGNKSRLSVTFLKK